MKKLNPKYIKWDVWGTMSSKEVSDQKEKDGPFFFPWYLDPHSLKDDRFILAHSLQRFQSKLSRLSDRVA